MNSSTATPASDRLVQDTEALLRMFAGGGTLAGLYGLSEHELDALDAFGLGYYQQARYADAMKVFARLVTMRHGEPRYLNALAAAHQMLGEHERAVHYWGVSQLLDPSDPVPTFHTAHSLLALGLVDDALDALEITLQQSARQPGHAPLHARAEALQALVRSKSTAARAA